MTVTKMSNAGGGMNNHQLMSQDSDFNYEVELEISDIKHLIAHAGNQQAFNSLVRRFLQNAASLTHLLA